VRNGIGENLQVVQRIARVTVDYFQLGYSSASFRSGRQRAMGQPDRNAIATGKLEDTANVVTVLVGNDDRRQGFRRY
jgi:hypothetical protein